MGGGPSSTASASRAGSAAAGATASGGGAAGGGAGAGAEPRPEGRLRVRLIDASFDLIASSESGDELGDELSASRGWTARRALEGALEGAIVVRPPLVRNEGKEPRRDTHVWSAHIGPSNGAAAGHVVVTLEERLFNAYSTIPGDASTK
eukprot:scaffold86540_cov43-Phaeocystis_antarctica.AAC.2